jgi:hypothetical protein
LGDRQTLYPANIQRNYDDLLRGVKLSLKEVWRLRGDDPVYPISTLVSFAFFVTISKILWTGANMGPLGMLLAGVAVLVPWLLFLKTHRSPLQIMTTFQGIIPQKTKEVIQEHKSRFDQIYILAEVDSWRELHLERSLPSQLNVDPLVLGYINGSQHFYVLDKFDITPLEHYVASEFTNE